MSSRRVLVVGNVNVETSLKLEAFPLPETSSYQPSRISVSVSGVGFNLARALQVLGTEVRLASIIGPDEAGALVKATLRDLGLFSSRLHTGARTGRSLVISDASGARHVHTDLEGVREATYPLEVFDRALQGCDLVVLTNIDYTRPLLARAVAAGVPVSTDLHAIQSLTNPYDQDYLAAASLLFLSGEHLQNPEGTVSELRQRFDPEFVIVGLGSKGALLSERAREVVHVPAFIVPNVVSTVGAGDALHAAFCHFWLVGELPERALRLACAFAAHKIMVAEGGKGFVSEAEVRQVTE